MKKFIILTLTATTLLFACSSNNEETTTEHSEEQHHNENVIASAKKVAEAHINIGKISKQKLPVFVTTNGKLTVPPQNTATVTAVIGANITSINIIEGDKVRKGQVLAYVSHPDLITLQTNYFVGLHELDFLTAEYNRINDLYQQNAISEKEYQAIKAKYLSKKAQVNGDKARLQQLNINVDDLTSETIRQNIAIVSPIDGYVNGVFVEVGEYVLPNTPMFSILNTEHLHADFIVYESDIQSVRPKQTVLFYTQHQPDKLIEATIFSVGKSFEQNPKAVHIHAEMKDESAHHNLLSGMYISGKIIVDSLSDYAIRKEAVFKDNNHFFAFKAKKQNTDWVFTKVPITIKDELTDYYTLVPTDTTGLFVQTNAYYIISEMQKEEMGHDD